MSIVAWRIPYLHAKIFQMFQSVHIAKRLSDQEFLGIENPISCSYKINDDVKEILVLCSYEIDVVKKDVKQKAHPITFIGIVSSILAEWCPQMRLVSLMLKAILSI